MSTKFFTVSAIAASLEAGAPTVTVTGSCGFVTPLSVSERPGIASVTTFECEAFPTPFTSYWASWPTAARLASSVSVELVAENVWFAPVWRLESTRYCWLEIASVTTEA